MNQVLFTAARLEQHRAGLMVSAEHARVCRQAKAARTRRGYRLNFPRLRRVSVPSSPVRSRQVPQAL
jgi:hypothetical protein